MYDVLKCLDKLWNLECINDLYEAGFINDNLNLLYLENITAQFAVKTSSGVTDLMNICDSIMQGTVWSGLFCTATMDKLGKQAYNNPNLLYKYRGSVAVPPLQMVDDLITANKCDPTSVTKHNAVGTKETRIQ